MKKPHRKRSLLLLALVQFAFQTYCQNYKEVLNDSAEWYYIRYSWGYTTDHTHLQGNETINDMVYDIYGYADQNGILAYIREDTAEKKIYKWICDREILLYDFSMKPGDSIRYESFGNCNSIKDLGYFILDSIKPINMEIETRNAYYLSGSAWWANGIVWVEGIGSMGIFEDPYEPVDSLNGGVLNCFYIGDELQYQSDISKRLGKCKYDNYNLILKQEDSKLLVFPNPATVSVELEGIARDSRMVVTDIAGRILFEDFICNSAQYQIDISTWVTGIYLVTIYSVNSDVSVVQKAKFIKQ